ncbi:MAG: hypothetical protein HY721_29120 [Planctomycetes bacterium]|nr:hypothetical protein [Planctomycetota bacterium]
MAQGHEGNAAPLQLPFQGRLLTAGGEPVPARNATMLFSLYESPTGGTAAWSSGPVAVEVKGGGMVNVLLGDAARPLTGLDFSRALYLGVRIDDPANAAALEKEPELLPRVQILPALFSHGAGHALDSSLLKGASWNAILAGGSDDPTSGLIRGDKVDPRYTVPVGAVILWRGATCPAGYRRVGELDGKFLVAGSTYNPAAGGSNTHAHGAGSYTAPSHTHSITDVSRGIGWNAAPGTGPAGPTNAVITTDFQSATAEPAGGETLAGRSGDADSRPEFATVLLCECEDRIE